MPDRNSFRFAASMLFAGIVFSFLAGIFHPDREPANNHPAVFAEYAANVSWTAVHLGQFVGMAIIIAALVMFFLALGDAARRISWAKHLGIASAVVALALYGVLQAVDGVALKQAVNAWASAPEAEKAARFATAEAVRWLEWGLRSYQSFMLGISFALFATVILMTTMFPKPIGYLLGLAGLAYLTQGWVLGSEGFSPNNSIPTLAGIVLVLISSIWLLITGWRRPKAIVAPATS